MPLKPPQNRCRSLLAGPSNPGVQPSQTATRRAPKPGPAESGPLSCRVPATASRVRVLHYGLLLPRPAACRFCSLAGTAKPSAVSEHYVCGTPSGARSACGFGARDLSVARRERRPDRPAPARQCRHRAMRNRLKTGTSGHRCSARRPERRKRRAASFRRRKALCTLKIFRARLARPLGKEASGGSIRHVARRLFEEMILAPGRRPRRGMDDDCQRTMR